MKKMLFQFMLLVLSITIEDHFNENYLESTKYPKADFKGYISNISQVNFTTDGKYNITAEGTLTIHGVSQKITVQGIMIISHGTPSINGSFKIKIKEYGITGLYIGDKIANEAEIALSVSY